VLLCGENASQENERASEEFKNYHNVSRALSENESLKHAYARFSDLS